MSESKLRIALMISGRTGFSWKNVFEFTKKNILDPLQPDVFLSTYLDPDIPHDESVKNIRDIQEAYGIYSENINVETATVRYPEHPVWAANNNNKDPLLNKACKLRMNSMFFHFNKAYNLIKNYSEKTNTKYDAVIKWRIDMYPDTQLPYDSFKNLNDKTIIIPHDIRWYVNIIPSWIPDHVCIGNMNAMSKFCNIYNNLEDGFTNNGINIDIQEETIYKHLHKEGISWSFTKGNWSYLVKSIYDKSTPSYSEINKSTAKTYNSSWFAHQELDFFNYKKGPHNLLQLMMIVNNCELSIRETLLSYKPFISYWYIIDNGSTDNTKQIILDTLNNIPGHLDHINSDGILQEIVTILRQEPLKRTQIHELAGSNYKVNEYEQISKDKDKQIGLFSKSYIELAKKRALTGRLTDKETDGKSRYCIFPEDNHVLFNGQNLLKFIENADHDCGIVYMKVNSETEFSLEPIIYKINNITHDLTNYRDFNLHDVFINKIYPRSTTFLSNIFIHQRQNPLIIQKSEDFDIRQKSEDFDIRQKSEDFDIRQKSEDFDIPKKRIALMISGRTNDSWSKFFEFTKKNILDPLEPDVFLSTYATDDVCSLGQQRTIDSNKNIQDIIKFYNINPSNVNIETFVGHELLTKTQYRRLSMLFHNKKVMELVRNYSEKNGIVYDYVIKYRIDIRPDTKLPEDSFILQNNCINIPRDVRYYTDCPINWCPDIIAIGSFETMTKYCNAYDIVDVTQSNISEEIINNALNSFSVKWSWTSLNWSYQIYGSYDDSTPNIIDITKGTAKTISTSWYAHDKIDLSLYINNYPLMLVMIVNNCELTIRETLLSYRPFITYWYIIDNCSTDNTSMIIQDTLSGIHGHLASQNPDQNDEIYFDYLRVIESAKQNSIYDGFDIKFCLFPEQEYIFYGLHKLVNIFKNSLTEFNTILIKNNDKLDTEDQRPIIFNTERLSKNSDITVSDPEIFVKEHSLCQNSKKIQNIALMFTGRVKNSWKNGLSANLKYIINILKPTIFVGTYIEAETDLEDLKEFAKAYNIPFTPEHFVIKTCPNPISENQRDAVLFKHYYKTFSLFFHNRNAFELVQNYSKINNVAFTHVIKWRSDIIPKKLLPKDTFSTKYDGLLVIPQDIYQYKPLPFNWIPDQIGLGTMYIMQKYCNIYNDIISFYYKYHIDFDIQEVILYSHISIAGIKWTYTNASDLFFYKLRYDDENHNFKMGASLIDLDPISAIKYFENRISETYDGDLEDFGAKQDRDRVNKEQLFTSYMNLGILYYNKEHNIEKSNEFFLKAIFTRPERTAECYYHLSGLIQHYIKDMDKESVLYITLNKLSYFYIKESTTYKLPIVRIEYMDTAVYTKHIPMSCITLAINMADNSNIIELQIATLQKYHKGSEQVQAFLGTLTRKEPINQNIKTEKEIVKIEKEIVKTEKVKPKKKL